MTASVPPPTAGPRPHRPSLPWVPLAAVALVAAIAVVVVVVAGGDGPTTSASSSTATIAATTSSAASSSTTPTTLPPTTSTIPEASTTTRAPGPPYGPAELEYFGEIAGGAEFGEAAAVLHRWATDVRLAVYGSPGPADRAALAAVVADINRILGTVEVTLVEGAPDIAIHFVPTEEFASIEPNYVPGNMGFVYIWWDGSGRVTSGRVLISTTGLAQDERSHLIREELTQSLGLLNDSWRYPESVFYQGWTTTTEYAPIDRAVIEMLYRPELAPGMTIADALTVLAGLP